MHRRKFVRRQKIWVLSFLLSSSLLLLLPLFPITIFFITVIVVNCYYLITLTSCCYHHFYYYYYYYYYIIIIIIIITNIIMGNTFVEKCNVCWMKIDSDIYSSFGTFFTVNGIVKSSFSFFTINFLRWIILFTDSNAYNFIIFCSTSLFRTIIIHN